MSEKITLLNLSGYYDPKPKIQIEWTDQSQSSYKDLDGMFEERGILDKWYIIDGDHDGGGYDDACIYLVINKETGELCELQSSHCSCYGYEGCWGPTPTGLKTIWKSMKQEARMGYTYGLGWRGKVYKKALDFIMDNRELFVHFGHEDWYK